MEVSIKLVHPRVGKMVSNAGEIGFREQACKLRRSRISCSCRAENNKVVMQKGKTNFYKVLSLDSENVGFEEIKKAYRSMVLRHHPDVCPPSAKEESTKRFLELQTAYETLSDPVSRKMHDYELGLIHSAARYRMQERISEFPREVWENQLRGLKLRSHNRMERNKK